MTKTEIAAKYIACTCGEVYKSRKMYAPDCAFCNEDWDEPMEEYAKQEAFLFSEFKRTYRHIEGVNHSHAMEGKLVSWIGADDETIWQAYKKGKQLKRYYEE